MRMLERVNYHWLTRFRDEHISDQYANRIKDSRDTGKPYKKSSYGYYVWRDVIQPLRGFKNLLMSILFLSAVPFIYLIGAVISVFTAFRSKHTYFNEMRNMHNIASLFLLASKAHFILGCIQVLTTPYTWLLRIPHRLKLTFQHGARHMEDSIGLNKNVDDINLTKKQTKQSDIKLLIQSTKILHARFKKAFWRGHTSLIERKAEQMAYAKIAVKNVVGNEWRDYDHAAVTSYVGLFTKAREKRKEIRNTSQRYTT